MTRALRFAAPVCLIALFPLIQLGAAPPTGVWTQSSSLAQARSGSAAVVLSDGRVLFSGGTGSSGPLATTEFYNTDGSFSSGAAMQDARANHSAVVLQDGRVLVAGGVTSGGAVTSAAEIYDPSTSTWTLIGSGLAVPRSGHTASLLSDGRVLIAGGQTTGGPTNSLEVFSPATNSFALVTSGTLSSARIQHAAAVLADGRVLIAGGLNGSNALNSVDLFDPASGSVSPAANMSTPRANLSATTLLDGTVLIAGGNNGSADLASAEIYNASAATFSATGNLAAARSGQLAFLLPSNNAVLIAGGSSGGTALASAELFYPWTGTFNATGAMGTPRAAAAGSALKQNGQLLVAGGLNGANPLASAELYGFATVVTDASDYPPGTTVNISGSGWVPGETVTLTLVESPLIDTHGPFSAVADSNGNISNSSFVTDSHDLSIRFYLTATGSISQAQNTFTDSNPQNLTLGTQTSAPILAGSSSTYSVTMTFTGNSTACTVNLTAATLGSPTWPSPPSGGFFSFAAASLTSSGSTQSTLLTVNTPTGMAANTYNFTVTATPQSGTCQNNPPTESVNGTLVLAGNATHLSVTGFPTSITAGTPGTFTVTALDSNNNTAIGYTGTVSFSSSDGQAILPGSYPFVGSDKGVHTFTNGATLKTAGTQSITASASGPISGSQTGITVSAGVPASVAATAGTPQSTPAGTPFSTALQATVRDANNNAVSGATVTFTAPTTGVSGKFANGTISTTAVTSSSGVATASVFTANTTTGSYNVTASVSGVATPANFSLTNSAGPAAKFVLSAPSTATAGTGFSVIVTAQDANGNIATGYTGTVKFSLGMADTGATLPANYTFVAGDAGAHTFTNAFMLTKAGTQTVVATDTGNASVTGTSGNISVAGAAANRLSFSQQPTNTSAGVAINPAVTVLIEDQFGNATNSTATVSMAILTNPGGATLGGSTAVAGAAGTATFSSLSINNAGIGYTLVASSSGLTSATSSSFNIESNLAFVSAAATEVAGACSPQVTVQRQNSNGSGASLPNSETVALSANVAGTTFYSDASCTTALSGGSLAIAANQSSASFFFKNTSATAPPFNLQLTASKTTDNLTATTTQSETVVPNIAFANGPGSANAGQCSATPAKIVAVDGTGATIAPSSPISITLATTSANGAFYSDSACTIIISTAAIPAGNKSGAMPFYKDNAVGTPTLTATGPGPVQATSQASISKAVAVFSSLSAPTINFGSTPTTFSGTVNKSGSLVPTGTVTITIAGTSGPISGTATLDANGNFSASIATGTIPAGIYTIQYAYPGDSNFNAPSPNPNVSNSLTVNQVSTTAGIIAPAITYPANGSVTVTVSSTAGTPGGSVSLSVDNGTAVSKPLSSGSATFTSTDIPALSNPSAGSHSLSANYAAQGSFAASAATGTLQVSYPSPTLTGVNPSSGSMNSTSNVTLAGTGFFSSVTTASFGTDITVNSVTVNSQTQLTANVTIPANATVGAHNVSVTNPTPGGGTATLTGAFTVNNPATTTKLNSSPNPSTYGMSVTFTAAVTSQAGTPTGSVNFYDGGTCTAAGQALGSVILNNGAASINTSSLAAGLHSVLACYAPTGIYQPSSAAPVAQQVNPALASVAVPSPVVTYNGGPQPVMPTVTPAVSYSETYTGISATVYATSNTAPTQPGSYTVAVTVTDPNYTGSNNGTLTISQATPALTNTGSSGTSNYGTGVVLSVTLTPPTGAEAPTGTVQFQFKNPTDGTIYNVCADGTLQPQPPAAGASPCVITLISDPNSTTHVSTATVTTTKLPASTTADAVTATYYPTDANYATGSTTINYTVNMASTQTTIAITPVAAPTYGDTVTLASSVSDSTQGSTGIPTGTVQFQYSSDSGNTWVNIGQPITLDQNGTAQTTTTTLLAGTPSIRAVYSGDSNYLTGSSGSTAYTVNPKTLTLNGLTASNKLYDGTTAATVDASGAQLQGVIGSDNVLLSGGATGTFSDANVGTSKTVTVAGLSITGTAASNYTLQQPTATANITAVTVTVTAPSLTVTYGDPVPSPLTPTYAGLVNNEGPGVFIKLPTCTTTYTQATSAGSNPTTACSGAAATNYTFIYVSGKITVNQATPTLSVSGGTYTYDGQAHPATVAISGVSGDNSLTPSMAVLTYTPGGSAAPVFASATPYSVTGSFAGNTNYKAVTSAAAITITQETPTITDTPATDGGPGNSSYGQPVTFSVTVGTPNGGVPTGSVTFTFMQNGTSYICSNGSISTTSCTAPVTYNSGTNSYTASVTTSQLPPGTTGDMITASYSGDTDFTPGTPNTVSVTVAQATTATTLSSSNAASATYGDQLTLTVKVKDNTQSSTGLPTGTVALTFRLDPTAQNPITYYVCADATNGGVSITPCDSAHQITLAADPNDPTATTAIATVTTTHLPVGLSAKQFAYNLNAAYSGDTNFTNSSVALPQTVNPRPITVTAVADSKTYDGTTSSKGMPTVTSTLGLVNGDTFTASQTFDNRNAGSNKTLTPTGTVTDGFGGANYNVNWAPANTGTINKLSITVTAVANSKVYDGGLTAAASPAITPALISGDGSGFTEAYSSKNVGTGLTLTPAGAVNDQNGGNNYAVTLTSAAAGTITQAPLTITAVTNTKVYDGGVSAAATPALAGLQPGDTVTGLSETYDTKNVGTGKTLSVATYTISDGNSGHNYTVTPQSNASGVITQAPLTITAKSTSKTYGTTVTFTGTEFTTSGTLYGGDAVSSVTLTSSGAPVTAAVGSYPILPSAALGTGLSNYSISYLPGALIVNPASTTTTLNSQVIQSSGAAVITLKAGVTSTVIPTGTITFIDTSNNNVNLGTAPLVSGQASIGSITSLTPGTHLISANYTPGNGNFLASTSAQPTAPTATITAPSANGDVFAVSTNVALAGTFTAATISNPTAVWTLTNTATNASTTSLASISAPNLNGTTTFASADVYGFTLTFTDGVGGIVITNTVAGSPATIVIYDPSAGFVTGGGWINSPAGAYAQNPGLTGKATFGFVSKYQKGATVPTGDTEFQFQVGNLDFHSNTYQWLVISGGLAQYKGTGTINGAGTFNFLLTARDGALYSAGTSDGFRIKITDQSGNLIYDNMAVTATNDDMTSGNTEALGGGSVIIHSNGS